MRYEQTLADTNQKKQYLHKKFVQLEKCIIIKQSVRTVGLSEQLEVPNHPPLICLFKVAYRPINAATAKNSSHMPQINSILREI